MIMGVCEVFVVAVVDVAHACEMPFTVRLTTLPLWKYPGVLAEFAVKVMAEVVLESALPSRVQEYVGEPEKLPDAVKVIGSPEQ